jgi:hypothetical protein
MNRRMARSQRYLVAVESPLRPKAVDPVLHPTEWRRQYNANIEYARACCKLVLAAEGNPFAMHLFFPQFLDEAQDDDRAMGIACGLDWTSYADELWFCTRPNEPMTPGMLKALEFNRLWFQDRPCYHVHTDMFGREIIKIVTLQN